MICRIIFHHISCFYFVSVGVYSFENYYLKLRSTAPAIEEVNVTFYADLYQSGGAIPENDTYLWVSEISLAFFLFRLNLILSI